jgi:hypothetical protein
MVGSYETVTAPGLGETERTRSGTTGAGGGGFFFVMTRVVMPFDPLAWVDRGCRLAST